MKHDLRTHLKGLLWSMITNDVSNYINLLVKSFTSIVITLYFIGMFCWIDWITGATFLFSKFTRITLVDTWNFSFKISSQVVFFPNSHIMFTYLAYDATFMLNKIPLFCPQVFKYFVCSLFILRFSVLLSSAMEFTKPNDGPLQCQRN